MPYAKISLMCVNQIIEHPKIPFEVRLGVPSIALGFDQDVARDGCVPHKYWLLGPEEAHSFLPRYPVTPVAKAAAPKTRELQSR